MSVFVEVDSVEKQCKVIINLDMVVEIAPLAAGGCALFFPDAQAVGGKTAMKVKDEYPAFQQFAMQTVSSDDIAKRVEAIKGRGRPSKSPIDIPVL